MLETPLRVNRTFSDGSKAHIGTLAENRAGTYFQFDETYHRFTTLFTAPRHTNSI